MSVTDSNLVAGATVRKRNDFRLAMQAKLTAEVCGSCGCGLAAGEPVYMWVAHRGYGAFGGSYSRHYAPVCEGCAPRWMVERGRSESAPTCDWCSRVVVYRPTGREYLRKHVFCCERCQWGYYNRRRSAADSWAREKVCQVCAEPFTATRAHAKTCSPACKQAAYRIRKKRKEY
jgi:hypothetical protein